MWQYTPAEAGWQMPYDSSRFYSPFISSAQRLPNGNTFITEGSGGRLLEVTPSHEIVWEFISPFWGKQLRLNMIYRAYRAPYEWVPQLDKPKETAIERIDSTKFQVPGAADPNKILDETTVPGTQPFRNDPAVLCIGSIDEK